MNALTVAILFVAVAYAKAGAIGLGLVAGHGVSAKGAVEGALGGQWIPDVPNVHSGATAKGVLEGALGGQWIPDVPVAHAAPAAYAAPLAAPYAAPFAAPYAAGFAAPLAYAAPALAAPAAYAAPAAFAAPAIGHIGVSRGAVEGALGGQWIPDVPVHGH